jgi:hypothetical protein
VNLDGRVAPGVENLLGGDRFDEGHGRRIAVGTPPTSGA